MRFSYNALTTAFFIWVLAGGLAVYTGTYDSISRRLPLLPAGPAAALVATGAFLLVYAAAASLVQVHVYRRGLRRWRARQSPPRQDEPEPAAAGRAGLDPRAIVLAAILAFALLIVSASWPPLAAVAVWLAAIWARWRCRRSRSSGRGRRRRGHARAGSSRPLSFPASAASIARG